MNLYFSLLPSGCDAAHTWQFGFQEAATPIMTGIIEFHNDLGFYLLLMLGFVSCMGWRVFLMFPFTCYRPPKWIVHGTTLELLWTIFPSFILMLIAFPSFALLYALDEIVEPSTTIKAIGHQWYWTYEYSDAIYGTENELTFDSYLMPEADLEMGLLRLLEVDHRVVVPARRHIRILVTAADVLHCWAVPSFGLKCDAVPGRLNQLSTFILRLGVYYGQCSELCGTYHAYMPIVVEAVDWKAFCSWVVQST